MRKIQTKLEREQSLSEYEKIIEQFKGDDYYDTISTDN